jgi:tetratricopeptide (TPR) repeat protein
LMSTVAIQMGDHALAASYVQAGIEGLSSLAEPHSTHAGTAETLTELLVSLGVLHATRENYAQAVSAFEKGLSLARQFGLTDKVTAILLNLGAVETGSGDYERARTHLLEAEGIIAQQPKPLPTRADVVLAVNLAQLAAHMTNDTEAEHDFQRALRLAHQLRQAQTLAEAQCEYAAYLIERQQFEGAEHLLQEALASMPPHYNWLRATATYSLARVYAGQGKLMLARETGQDSLALYLSMSRDGGDEMVEHLKRWLEELPSA